MCKICAIDAPHRNMSGWQGFAICMNWKYMSFVRWYLYLDYVAKNGNTEKYVPLCLSSQVEQAFVCMKNSQKCDKNGLQIMLFQKSLKNGAGNKKL